MPARYPEAAFLSAVTAGATHEMRNVLAIIKESAGLLGDMVNLHAAGRTLDPERLRRAVDRVDVQVKRGASILTALNRISHAIDEDLKTLDLDEELRQAVFLSQRRARVNGVTLLTADPLAVGQVRANPLHLHMALFFALDRCIEAHPEGTSLVAKVLIDDTAVSVEFRGEPEPESALLPEPNGESWKEAQAWVSASGGKLHVLDHGRVIEIRFDSA